MNFQSNLDIKGYKTYLVTLFKIIIMALGWCRPIMKIQFYFFFRKFGNHLQSSKIKASSFECWSKENVSVNLRAFYYTFKLKR